MAAVSGDPLLCAEVLSNASSVLQSLSARSTAVATAGSASTTALTP